MFFWSVLEKHWKYRISLHHIIITTWPPDGLNLYCGKTSVMQHLMCVCVRVRFLFRHNLTATCLHVNEEHWRKTSRQAMVWMWRRAEWRSENVGGRGEKQNGMFREEDEPDQTGRQETEKLVTRSKHHISMKHEKRVLRSITEPVYTNIFNSLEYFISSLLTSLHLRGEYSSSTKYPAELRPVAVYLYLISSARSKTTKKYMMEVCSLGVFSRRLERLTRMWTQRSHSDVRGNKRSRSESNWTLNWSGRGAKETGFMNFMS